MRTVKLVISYDGTGYCGWQRQKNGPTIQAEIEHAVSIICDHSTTIHGAGRTDAGVHALGMSAHFQTLSRIHCKKLIKGLNALLPSQIRILEVADQPEDFHARYWATGKTYRYSFFTGAIQCPRRRLFESHYPSVLSSSAVNSCLQLVVGTHDFSSFETSGTRDKTITTGKGATRKIFRAQLEQPEPELYHLFFSGDGFLRHMIRNMAGTIIEVGQGKFTVNGFERIFESRDRRQAGPTAPAHGLTLISVDYSNSCLPDKERGPENHQNPF
jgi:tRNA pseudouridine38-40 synthase